MILMRYINTLGRALAVVAILGVCLALCVSVPVGPVAAEPEDVDLAGFLAAMKKVEANLSGERPLLEPVARCIGREEFTVASEEFKQAWANYITDASDQSRAAVGESYSLHQATMHATGRDIAIKKQCVSEFFQTILPQFSEVDTRQSFLARLARVWSVGNGVAGYPQAVECAERELAGLADAELLSAMDQFIVQKSMAAFERAMQLEPAIGSGRETTHGKSGLGSCRSNPY